MIRVVAGRLAVAPFECAISLFLVLAGVAQLLSWGVIDPVNALLPQWEVVLFACVTIIGGAAVPVALAGESPAGEAFGLLLQSTVFVSRLILYGVYLGPDTTFFLSGAFDVIFLAAAFTRLSTVRSRRVVIELREGGGDAGPAAAR